MGATIQKYGKILKNIPQITLAKSWKFALYLTLILCWAVILLGTFKLL